MLFTYIVIGILPLLIFTNLVFNTLNNYYVEERKKDLLGHANVISGYISLSGYFTDDDDFESLSRELEKNSEKNGYRIMVLSSSGLVVSDSYHADVGKTYLIPEVIEALDNKDVAREQPSGAIYAAVSIVGSGSERMGCVLISASSQDIVDTMNGVEKQVYVMLLSVLAVVGILMVVISKLVTDPLKQMLIVIKKMSDGHLDQRVPVNEHSHNEITDLAVACNTMAEKLEQVESTRQQFVSNVSHELKTPLSSIKVLSESILLENDVPKEMYVEFLQDINSEVDRLTAIINDLLSLVRLGQKEIPHTFEEASLNKILEDIVKRMLPLAKNKDIALQYEALKDCSAEVDAMKLSLALSNLVDNAIKYTPEGGTVKVLLDADHQNAFITVSDTGVGIAEEELGKIFDRFYRVDKTRGRETGGTGLGLSITHSTILLHNGSIKVTSKEEEGTTFVVRLPLRQAAA